MAARRLWGAGGRRRSQLPVAAPAAPPAAAPWVGRASELPPPCPRPRRRAAEGGACSARRSAALKIPPPPPRPRRASRAPPQEDDAAPYMAPTSVFESSSHLLHGALHLNGYGHLLRMNAGEGAGGARLVGGLRRRRGPARRARLAPARPLALWLAPVPPIPASRAQQRGGRRGRPSRRAARATHYTAPCAGTTRVLVGVMNHPPPPRRLQASSSSWYGTGSVSCCGPERCGRALGLCPGRLWGRTVWPSARAPVGAAGADGAGERRAPRPPRPAPARSRRRLRRAGARRGRARLG